MGEKVGLVAEKWSLDAVTNGNLLCIKLRFTHKAVFNLHKHRNDIFMQIRKGSTILKCKSNVGVVCFRKLTFSFVGSPFQEDRVSPHGTLVVFLAPIVNIFSCL